ncbi:MAG: phosphoribosylformimino-5-aminoimidazole carboxamide ribotide isomerase [Eubacteriales bacterium]|nr:phosphoribosylformimino-5-aminoimidazole carboxamide ribotide isomerase [Lachnospiraceae bacterium]MDO5127647.1 phosphoribosylformimino-5-aminoimidazole carboxamide ribotide isomerase [Eubacteriales bacterium]
MHFRPCIDIHNGAVKQIVGGSLRDEADYATDNYVSGQGADFFAKMYRDSGLSGGHIILLNPPQSEYYEADVEQAERALRAYPGGLQIGGGINSDNAKRFLDMGASHVIVTSYVFRDGKINYENLNQLIKAVGKERLVLDLSCRKRDGMYYIVTDRWQKYTDVVVCHETLDRLASYCNEYLIHAVDVEGKAQGIETELVRLLGAWGKLPMTYAGGVASFEDLQTLRTLGKDCLDVTIGSALDIFGGTMRYEDVLDFCQGKMD